MKSKKKMTVVVSAVCILAVFTIVAFSGVLGISSAQVEQDARKRYKIDSTWQVSQSFHGKLYVMVFYNDTLDQHLYSIYRNQTGLPIGYFFTSGNSVPEGVSEFDYGNAGSALISMNKEKVEKIQYGNDKITTTREIDPEKPFTVILPTNGEGDNTLTLYDVNQHEVSLSGVIIPDK